MSKAAPSPKSNFLQMAMIMMTIYLGMVLFFGPKNSGGTDAVLTPQEILTRMQKENASRLDLDIVRSRQQLEGKVDDWVKAGKLTAPDGENMKVQALILAADCQLKAGVHSGEINRLENSFNTIANYDRKHSEDNQWNQYKVDIPADNTNPEMFTWRQWTGHELYAKVVDTLSVANKKDLVWGFIPGYQIIDFLVGITGRVPSFSYAFAAFLLALLVRGLVLRLSMKQIMFGRQMSQLSPLLKDIREKYKDPAEQQKKTMELYQEYGINPFSGCLPAFIQLPFFITVYRCMLHYRFDFQQGVFLWINKATSISTHGFTAPNLGMQDNILIFIYGISMITSTLLMPVTDPTQVKQQKGIGLAMAVIFTGMMFSGAFPVPSAFVLYWTFTNMLATAQSLYCYRLPLPPLQKVNAPGGGSYPFDKFFNIAGMNNPNALNGANGNGASSNGSITTNTGKPAQHKPKKRK